MPYKSDEQRRAVWARRRKRQGERKAMMKTAARSFFEELDKLADKRFQTAQQRSAQFARPPAKKKDLVPKGLSL
jgi:hypothetical protein